MAFKLGNLKNLFRKLTPYADDVAKGVANYGDDVARLAANYGDDAARIAQHTGDPLGGFVETGPLGNTITHYMNVPGRVDIDGKPFHYPIRYTPQNALKEKLLDARTGLGKPDAGDFIDEAMVLGEAFPKNQLVESTDPHWRPHKNTALGRWFERNVPKDYKGFIDDFGDEYFIF